MSALLTTDYLAAEALTICAAAGRPELEVQVSDYLDRKGKHLYSIAAFDPDGERNPLDCHCAYVLENTTEATLGKLAEKLGVEWPMAWITGQQKQDLMSLYNDPRVKSAEKVKMMLRFNQWSWGYAAQHLEAFRKEVAQRPAPKKLGRYAVVGSAEMVQPEAVAA